MFLFRNSSCVWRCLGNEIPTSPDLQVPAQSVPKQSTARVRGRKRLESVIHAFISSRLDYCNGLYLGVSQSLLSRLQLVQNAATRLLTGTRKREHISPVLISLHWLPVKYRIHFKSLLFVYKGLHGLAPSYISDLLFYCNASRELRSNSSLKLTVPRTRLKLKGDRAFSVAAPQLWNNLPSYIRSAPTYADFKFLLKTYLFTVAYGLK